MTGRGAERGGGGSCKTQAEKDGLALPDPWGIILLELLFDFSDVLKSMGGGMRGAPSTLPYCKGALRCAALRADRSALLCSAIAATDLER